MKVKVPLTGKVIGFNPEYAKIDGKGTSGDPSNPIRPVIAGRFQNCGWRMVSTDLETDECEIELLPAEDVAILKPGGDPDNRWDWISRETTEQERQGFLDAAMAMVEGKTKDQLYAETGCERLKKEQKHVDDFKALKAIQEAL